MTSSFFGKTSKPGEEKGKQREEKGSKGGAEKKDDDF